MEKKTYFGVIIFIYIVWSVTHLFSLSWGLPNSSSFAVDCVVPQLHLDAHDMMRKDTYKYPPLQYLIYDWLTSEGSEKGIPFSEVIAKRSVRIKTMRLITAVMSLISAEIVALIAMVLFNSWRAGMFAGCFFLLNPLSIFYSHTTNMDQPCVMWWVLSLSALVAAEKFLKHENGGKLYYCCHLLCGVFIGCAFCTKDQIYAVYVLPFLGFLVWYYLSCKRVGRTLILPLLWSGTFILTVWGIYLLIGGNDIFRYHFQWITSGGVKGYQQVSGSIAGRTVLFFKSLKDVCILFDYPLILLSVLFLLLYFIERGRAEDNRTSGKLLLFLLSGVLLGFISLQLLFVQVTRYTHPRYYLPLLPFVCVIFGGAYTVYVKHIWSRVLFFGVLLFQFCLATQLLYTMTHDSRVRLRTYMKEFASQGNKRSRTVNTGAFTGGVFKFGGENVKEMKIIRHFAATEFGNFAAYQRAVKISPLSLTMISPKYVITKKDISDEKRKILTENSYQLINTLEPYKNYLTLFPYISPAFNIFERDVEEGYVNDKNFEQELQALSLEEQLLWLQHYFDPALFQRQAKLVGKFLKGFKEPDLTNYRFKGMVISFVAIAYEFAGRMDDAAKAHINVLTSYRDRNLHRNAILFYLKYPELQKKFNVQIFRSSDGGYGWRVIPPESEKKSL